MNEMDDRLPLRALDPGSDDPGFWVRFHTRVMDRARSELARRGVQAEPTVAEVVFAWRRTLIPVTLLAAALAGVILASHAREAQSSPPPVALEEILREGIPDAPIPTVLTTEGELDEVAFLSSMERF
mgnify:CR=1 FL=1